MKKTLLVLMLALCSLPSLAQSCYWVFFADKQGVTFDPYAYFDEHAIARYRQCGADLYDITNYPLNQNYVSQVDALAIEEVGQSRWLNAVAIVATPIQIAAVEKMPFVSHTALIGGGMQLAQMRGDSMNDDVEPASNLLESMAKCQLAPQVLRMQGDKFVAQGFTGKGIRIAVLDGGFPKVDIHPAFKHLRVNNRILDTWNFPSKCENVYGWNSHGLMTLSCITGQFDSLQIGLATGAEFLLYRTEVNTEPFKEEVWWMRAMERADQHGANIISSSLGYGKERYFTKDMDGTSYVARAANLAARKGILVCNSAGNEGTDKAWKTIITPADADSVLCVAGTTADLDNYEHISFSSYGPSADGRFKPNVAAFGEVYAAAARNIETSATTEVQGTSFSCPLVAGFAACAWEASPGRTNMEMFQLIQQSGDLYPYYDYALGYGVPQASFFLGERDSKKPTFRFLESADSVSIQLLVGDSVGHINIFFNKQRPDGTLVKYANCGVEMSSVDQLRFHKGALDSCTLNVWCLGYTDSYKLNTDDRFRMQWEPREFNPEYSSPNNTFSSRYDYVRTADDLKPSQWGSNSRYRADYYLQFGDMISLSGNDMYSYWSPTFHIGGRVMRAFTKAYAWGLGLEYATFTYNINSANRLDDNLLPASCEVSGRKYRDRTVALELFQRIRIVPGGLFGKGLSLDLGVYVSRDWGSYHVKSHQYSYASRAEFYFANPMFVDNYKWNYGATARLSYDCIGVYARYRLTGLGTMYDLDPNSPTAFFMQFPRLEMGINLQL